MSGGSLDYIDGRLRDALRHIERDTPLRRAFVAHMHKVCDALHEIEWADSGDTSPGVRDVAAMLACLGPNAELEQLVREAEQAAEALRAALETAREQR